MDVDWTFLFTNTLYHQLSIIIIIIIRKFLLDIEMKICQDEMHILRFIDCQLQICVYFPALK